MARRRDRHRLLVDRDRAAVVREGVVSGRAARARGRRRHPHARRHGVRGRARLPGDHAGRGAVDEPGVVGLDRRHGVGVVDGVAARRHIDVLLADRHGAGRVREGVVRGDGTRAGGGAVGERGCHRGGRRVVRRAARHRGEHRLVLPIDPAGVARRDRRHGVVVGDACARGRDRHRLLLDRDRASRVREVVIGGCRRRAGGRTICRDRGDVGEHGVRRRARRLRREH